MSTQINVTVERGDLVERAKAEQQKNRRQKLEADARRKVAAQARAAREQAQTPIPERLPSVAGRRDELAAQRQALDSLILRPTLGSGYNEWFEAYENAMLDVQVTGKVYPKHLGSGSSNYINFGRPTYLPGGGPNGTAALASVPYSNTGGPAENYVNLYPIVPDPNPAPKGKTTKEATLQYYFYLCDSFTGAQSSSAVTAFIGGLEVGASIISTFDSIVNGVVQYGKRKGLFFRLAYNIDWNVANDDSFPFEGQWNHVAMTFRDKTFYAFLNGKLIHTQATAVEKLFLSSNTGFPSLQFGFGNQGWGYSPGPAARSGDTVKIHGLKYEARCKWTSDFTSPASLP